ncbi:MAG: helix-turn-helix domain-containing protein [Thermoguttaceae bacterium]
MARLLDQLAQPVYLVDDEGVLVFANRACLEWVGLGAEQLQATQCRYHTPVPSGGPEAVASGLCPPPEALAGREMAAVVGCPVAEGRLSRRRARFIPLWAKGSQLGAGGPAAILAIVEPDEVSPQEALSLAAADEAARLHEKVRTFRHQMAGRWRIDWLAGDSPVIRRVRAQLELAAASRANVLLVGPAGSGRHHAARAIHYGASPGPAGTLVPLACSILEEDLIVSTVANLASKRLPPENSGRGTLLLTDADTVSPAVQAELFRLFSGKSFPLRVIATAQRPLAELARQGKYREELALLLSTLVIELPPLAERRADLPVLLQLFLEEANSRRPKQLSGFSPEALDALDAYAWPGNVDELVQVVNHAHDRAEGPQITLGDLPQQIHLAAAAAAHPRRVEQTIVLDELLAQIERELIGRALARSKGNKTKAARLLGMTRPRLYRRMVQLGLESPGAQPAPGSQQEAPPA